MLKKNNLFRINMLIAIAVIACTALFIWLYDSSGKELTVGYGDKFPNITVKQENSDVTTRLSMNEKYNVILYLSQSCSICIKNLSQYNQLLKSYQTKTSFRMLWEDTVPRDKVESLGISLDKNYYLNKEYSLSNSYPAYFIVDENSKIVFFTNDLSSFKNKLKQI